MATIKFSELSAAASLASTAYFPGVQNGQNIRATIPVISAAIGASGTPLDQTAATAVIPLNLAGRHMADYTITAPVEFTIASSPAPVNGGNCVVAVIASGATANIPTYGSLIYQEGSWNNATARVNLLNFSRVASRNFVEIKPTTITADFVAPTLASASIPTAGTTLVMTYNENLLTTGDGVPTSGDFSISAATATTVSSATVSGAVVTLALSRTVNSGETVTLGYSGGASGRIQDTSGNLAASLTGQAVTNNSTQGWTPASISGLWAWYKKGVGQSTTGWLDDKGSAAKDLSGSGVTVVGGEGALNPGSGDLNTGAQTLNQPCTIFMRVKAIALDNNDRLFSSQDLWSVGLYRDTGLGPDRIRLFAGTDINTDLPADSTYRTVICVLNGASSVLRVDGTEVTGDIGSANMGGFYFANSSFRPNANYKEIVIKAGAADATERANYHTWAQTL